VDRHRLDWDEPIERTLSGFPHPGVGISVRRIGSHLSGMGDLPDDERARSTSIEERWRVVAGRPRVHEPGVAHLCATDPFTVIAAVLEKRESSPFPAVVRREVLDPLEMDDTLPDDPHTEIPNRTTFTTAGEDGPVPSTSTRAIVWRAPGSSPPPRTSCDSGTPSRRPTS
jgi:CubicO group peptidase (beta-lactamase class C family)